jgi:hypothetical protein
MAVDKSFFDHFFAPEGAQKWSVIHKQEIQSEV